MKNQNDKKFDPRNQFSKKLARRTEWFWFFYMTIIIALLAYQPNVGNTVTYLAIMASIVMITSVLAYTRNSTYEKALYVLKDIKIIENNKVNSEDDSEEEGENG